MSTSLRVPSTLRRHPTRPEPFARGRIATRRGREARLLLGLLGIVLSAVALLSCGASAGAPPPSDAARRVQAQQPAATSPILVILSLDGFRWDYLDLHQAPTLSRLAAEGARSEGLIPTFPSKTFPSHYTAVTGLHPENHGIVGNNMWDPVFGSGFSLDNREAVEDGRWWGGEPIWITAEKQGRIAATYFWPGSEAEIQGERPTFWKRFDNSVPAEERVDEVLEWLSLPEGEKPSLVTLYFSDVDSAGHRHGPSAPQTAAAVARVDGYVKRLIDGLTERNLRDRTSVVITSDHGMATMDPDQVLVLEDHIDLDDVQVVDLSCIVMLQPKPGARDRVLARLKGAHPHLHVALRDEVPERLRYRLHRRIPEIVGWMDPGWYVYETNSQREAKRPRFSLGMHGFDNQERDMHGILIAQGPAFLAGAVIPPLENVHLYEMFARILGLEPAPNDGDPARTAALLRRP